MLRRLAGCRGTIKADYVNGEVTGMIPRLYGWSRKSETQKASLTSESRALGGNGGLLTTIVFCRNGLGVG